MEEGTTAPRQRAIIGFTKCRPDDDIRDVVLGTCTCTRVVLEYKFVVLVLVLVLGALVLVLVLVLETLVLVLVLVLAMMCTCYICLLVNITYCVCHLPWFSIKAASLLNSSRPNR